MVVLNFCVFLYNQGERKAATKQFNNFEQRMQKLGKDGVNNIDQEVYDMECWLILGTFFINFKNWYII